MQFPVVRTRVAGLKKTFDLSTPETRREYFEAKVGKEIGKLQKYFGKNSTIVNMVGKKNSGKGTYIKMFLEAVNVSATHLSIGDLVRSSGIINRTVTGLVSTEEVVRLLKNESGRLSNLVLLDGLPRNLDQIETAVGVRKELGLKPGKDLFALIDIPDAVMDERMKSRVICPICKTPRSPKLLLTKHIKMDQKTGEIYLLCDNEKCQPVRMVKKEGDELGIEPIRGRLEDDARVMEAIIGRNDLEKVFLSASIPVSEAHYVDEYEIHKIYSHEWDKKAGRVISVSQNWVFKDDLGRDSYTLFPPAVTVHLIKEMVRVFLL